MENWHLAQQEQASGAAARPCPAVMDTLNVGVVCCLPDDDLTFVWGNACFYSGTGYTAEEFTRLFPDLRRYYAEIPEDFAYIRREVSRALLEQASRTALTVPLPLKNGRFSKARLSLSCAQDDAGRAVLHAVFTDIGSLELGDQTLLRQKEQKEEYFHWMMDAYGGNVYISDMDTYELLYVNKTASDTLGMPVQKLLGKKCYAVIQGRTSPCPFCTNDRICEEEFYDWEFFNPTLKRTFMIKNRVIHWKGRRARIELSYDMFSTEYKLAKKDREREALLNSIPGGFARLDARDCSTVLWYGAGFLEMIGYTEQQFSEELHSQCSYIHPDDMARIVPVMQRMKASGENVVTEARVITRGGETKTLTISLYYAGAEDSWDGIPSFYTVGLDVTADRREQERQRQALEDAYNAARVASDAKTNFLSSMSHDIRTPMNAIMGMTIIAQANLTAPEKVHDCLEKINASGRHLLSLINEILDMSRIESGKIDLASETVSLPELFQDVMDIFQPLVAEKQQELRIDAAPVRHEQVVTDGGRLQQVLMNLLSNAVKYTPPGGSISMRIRELPSIVDGRGQYEFVCSDNGIGMSQEFLGHVFEPFSRAEDSRISQTQGTGLGLAITENIVRMMNGTIEVKSELGGGSQFTVSLPLELCLEQEEETCQAELAGHAVLVVDDDQIVCESATALLNELGMRGRWVLSGEEAVDCVLQAHHAKDDFFAVILDWKMPGMNGLDTVHAIRRQLGADVPIIISAYDYSDIEEEFRRAGADAFITKPLFKSKILHVLQLFCHSEPCAEAVAAPAEKCQPALAGKHVLLVEDNDLNREIAAELLQMQGIVADEAENGQAAVEKFLASAPGEYDCILMDVQMPVMNGYEATKTIRALKRADAQTVPILALTANAFATDLGKARSAGMNDHIAKPIDMEQLLDTLQKWMGEKD